MDIRLDVNLTGMKELEEAIQAVDESYCEFSKAANKLREAARNLGVEINQPTAGTDG